jgi:hypothetical protein
MLLIEPSETPSWRAMTRYVSPLRPTNKRIATNNRVCISIGLPRWRRVSWRARFSLRAAESLRTPSTTPIFSNTFLPLLFTFDFIALLLFLLSNSNLKLDRCGKVLKFFFVFLKFFEFCL